MIIPVLTQHYAMLQRTLLYTGVTRGKKLVVLVGQKKAVAMRCATCRGGNVGRAHRLGQNRLSHDSSAWRVELWSQRTFFLVRPPLDGIEPTRTLPLQATRARQQTPRKVKGSTS